MHQIHIDCKFKTSTLKGARTPPTHRLRMHPRKSINEINYVAMAYFYIFLMFCRLSYTADLTVNYLRSWLTRN